MKIYKIRKIIFVLITEVIVFSAGTTSWAQYSRIYEKFLDQARTAIRQKDYREALLYLKTAQQADPSRESELLPYLTLVQQGLAGDTDQESSLTSSPRSRKSSHITSAQGVSRTRTVPSPRVAPVPELVPVSAASVTHRMDAVSTSPGQTGSVTRETPSADSSVKKYDQYATGISAAPAEIVADGVAPEKAPLPMKKGAEEQGRKTHVLDLDEQTWQKQPNTEIEIYLDQALRIRGQEIQRFLAVTPDVIFVTRVNNREILITPQAYGRTFLHIWEGDRRWTFFIKVIFAAEVEKRYRAATMLPSNTLDPWHFIYDLNWDSFSYGPSVSDLERQSLSVRNYFSLAGPTPYGRFDTYANTSKTDGRLMDLRSYSAGLTEARWMSWKDIELRLFDATHPISPLTFPATNFRGVLLDGRTDDERFEMAYLYGRDRGGFGLLSSDVEERESYFEAARVTYHPSATQGLSLNFARSWGDQRPESASPRTVSVQYDQEGEAWATSSEIGVDDDQSAQVAWVRHATEDGMVFVKARNMPADYTNVTGPMGTQGEVGLEVSLQRNWASRDSWRAYLDVYRDRESKNPDSPDALNVDFSGSLFHEITPSDFLTNQVFHTWTPGLLSDRVDSRISGTYGHRFDMFRISNALVSWTGLYQRSRSGSSPSSDYDRISLLSNLSVPLYEHLHSSIGYEISCVNDVMMDDQAWPSVLTADLIYSRALSQSWRTSVSLYYRDEENTEDSKSFLGGQDSLTLSTNVTFVSSRSFEVYLDGRFRDVWAENSRSDSFMESDVRLGVHMDWDTGFRWNPTAVIEGYVFKDVNKNEHKDDDEPGISGIRVRAGEKTAVTDDTGWYMISIRASRATVALDENTFPEGFVFHGASSRSLTLEQHAHYQADFSLSTDTGIYGVMFFDENGNGLPDNGDIFVPRVKIALDNRQTILTDSKGAYFFYGLTPGRHTVSIDMGTVPEIYLPTIPLQNTLDISEGVTYILHIPVKRIQPRNE